MIGNSKASPPTLYKVPFIGPPLFLVWLATVVHFGLCFYFSIRENVVQVRTDPLSISFGLFLTSFFSMGMILAGIRKFRRMRWTLLVLHLPSLFTMAYIGLVGNKYIAFGILIVCVWNLFSIFLKRQRIY